MRAANDFTPTASLTIGPFFHFALTADDGDCILVGPGAAGERVRLIIRVYDGAAAALGDCMVEVWQADASGSYDTAGIQLAELGRRATDQTGACVFETVRPGRVPGPGDSLQAPHINIRVLGRGLLEPLFTRAYFDGDPANVEDPILALVPENRRGTLLARPDAAAWRFDIHLCGDRETVFFDA